MNGASRSQIEVVSYEERPEQSVRANKLILEIEGRGCSSVGSMKRLSDAAAVGYLHYS